MEESRFIQREISWNDFNSRVLAEGLRTDIGLLDRLKFIAITSSNYDEFFMVRVARLMRDTANGDVAPEGLSDLKNALHNLIHQQDDCVRHEILPSLAKEGLVIREERDWEPEIIAWADRIFERELFPLATPVAITENRNLNAMVSPLHIHAAFNLDNNDLSIIRLPDNISRLRDFRIGEGHREIILLEEVLLRFGDRFFSGRTIESSCLFRITRDADMSVDEKRDEDFIAAMEEVLDSRDSSFPVRLESRGDPVLANRIRLLLELPELHHFTLRVPLDLSAFMALTQLHGFERLREIPPSPQPAQDLAGTENIWDTLKDRDVLLHHPYETYTPIIRMLDEAADDPATLAIKMTLYRTSGDSPLVKALIRAAQRGIQVMVLIELKARFDEGANINWAAQLEKAGAIVIYGLAILKVHAKALMIVRREDDAIRRYVHLGTGNYNEKTARLYTDMGLLTSREAYTRDTALFFNAVTGYSAEPHLKTLHMAPFSIRREITRLIKREAERAKGGEEARIVAKMNALVDPDIIDNLYAASEAGVTIDLNVRGICCLRPGIKGLSENIRVVSVIDTFLEHTRACVFRNGGRPEVFLSSADWMTRNLNRRVELLFPITEPLHKRRIRNILDSFFKDNCQSWQLNPDNSWTRRTAEKRTKPYRVQEQFARQASTRAGEQADAERKSLQIRRKPVQNAPR